MKKQDLILWFMGLGWKIQQDPENPDNTLIIGDPFTLIINHENDILAYLTEETGKMYASPMIFIYISEIKNFNEVSDFLYQCLEAKNIYLRPTIQNC
jgi:hypothetical protein